MKRTFKKCHTNRLIIDNFILDNVEDFTEMFSHARIYEGLTLNDFIVKKPNPETNRFEFSNMFSYMKNTPLDISGFSVSNQDDYEINMNSMFSCCHSNFIDTFWLEDASIYDMRHAFDSC